MTRKLSLLLLGLFCCTLAGLPQAQPAANVTGPELVFKTDVLASGGVPNFPDGNLSFRWPPTVGRAHPIFFGSSSGQMARLDIPTLAQRCPPIAGIPGYYTYAGGAGVILTNPLDARWLCITHVERKPASGNFRGELAMIVSSDYGQTWNWLGPIIEPQLPFSDPLPITMEIGGGPTVLKGEYLLCYYRETTSNRQGRQCVAYARAYDVYFAAQNSRVISWKKWSGGALPNDNDPPALGGTVGAQLQGLPAETDWCSAVYVAGNPGYFLMATCPFAAKRIYAYRSNDALSWQPMFGGAQITNEPGFHYYPNLVGLNPDTTFVTFDQGGWIWLYYLVTPKDPFDWTGAEVHRRRFYPN